MSKLVRRMTLPRLLVLAALALALVLPGCRPKRSQPAQRPPPPGYAAPQGYYPGYGQPPPGQPPPGQPPPRQPGPGQSPPGQYQPPPPRPGPAPAPAPAAPVQGDPINAIDIGFLRSRAQNVLGKLVNALPDASRAKVQGIPLVADPTVGDVNAFAACDNGVALMAITDGLLEIQAHMAQFRATDEVFRTNKLDQYIHLLATKQKPGGPIVRPPAGFVDPSQHTHGQKVARQHQLMDEQLAFVLGHELAHHHLGHTGCANGANRGLSPAAVGRVLSNAVPVFNQPNEIGSDVAGINNLLTAGSREQGYKWTEAGALLTLNFFAGLDKLTPTAVIFGFERTHPHPLIRIPIVQQTAATWRATGGNNPLPFPFPF